MRIGFPTSMLGEDGCSRPICLYRPAVDFKPPRALIPWRGMATYGYAAEKPALVKRLHRIEGQVRGIEKMVDDDRYCIDILTQIAAATTALDALALQILDDHIRHCVAGALASGDEGEAREKTDELLQAVRRFARTR